MEESYDASGRVASESFFDETHRPVVIRDGFARSTSDYDARGNLTLNRYFDANGAPGHANGMSAVRYEYDRFDQLKAMHYLGLHDTPANTLGGFARIDVVRDRDGRVLVWDYFDAAGAPVDMLRFRYILVPYAGAAGAPSRVTRTESEANRLADDALRRIRGGASFATVQDEISDDSGEFAPLASWGVVRIARSRVKADWTSILFALPLQGPSEVVPTAAGFWIFKRE